MSLKFKGIYRSENQLPCVDLPEGARCLREPRSFGEMNLVAMGAGLPFVILIVLAVAFSHSVHGVAPFEYPLQLGVGYVLALAFVLPHELLHAAALPKNAEVGLWIAPKQLAAFVATTVPMSKKRLLFVSVLPSLVLGWIPLTVWLILEPSPISAILFSFGALGTLFGAGDMVNVFNVATQVPRGATVQNSGFHTYWYSDGEQGAPVSTVSVEAVANRSEGKWGPEKAVLRIFFTGAACFAFVLVSYGVGYAFGWAAKSLGL